MPIFGLPQMLRGIDLYWSEVSLLERMSINKAVDDLSPTEKDHLFTVLEEKPDYLANLEESVCKKALKAGISQIGILQRRFKARLRKKYVSEEETPFVKHAFL
jgi:hypothetical protein